MILGVDYASVDDNTRPDFTALHRWGARFAVIRAAFMYGGASLADATWERDHAAARAAGIQVAPFVPLDWSGAFQPLLERLLDVYPARARGDLPVALDVEGASGLAPAHALTKVEEAVTALQAHGLAVMIYTSNNVWVEQLGDLPSVVCGACPLWLKVGYPWRARNPPHPEKVPPASPVPRPWRSAGSPGAFVEQFQGDAIEVPGFTSTVDVNVFLTYKASASDPRTTWIRTKLEASRLSCGDSVVELDEAIRAFQSSHQLDVDGRIGPATWAELCRA